MQPLSKSLKNKLSDPSSCLESSWSCDSPHLKTKRKFALEAKADLISKDEPGAKRISASGVRVVCASTNVSKLPKLGKRNR
jgi:hypothetical protein